jgi:hypothetical protein
MLEQILRKKLNLLLTLPTTPYLDIVISRLEKRLASM